MGFCHILKALIKFYPTKVEYFFPALQPRKKIVFLPPRIFIFLRFERRKYFFMKCIMQRGRTFCLAKNTYHVVSVLVSVPVSVSVSASVKMSSALSWFKSAESIMNNITWKHRHYFYPGLLKLLKIPHRCKDSGIKIITSIICITVTKTFGPKKHLASFGVVLYTFL